VRFEFAIVPPLPIRYLLFVGQPGLKMTPVTIERRYRRLQTWVQGL